MDESNSLGLKNSQKSNIQNLSPSDESEKNNEELRENYETEKALEIINNFNTEHNKQHKNTDEKGRTQICTNIKDIDWLGNIFLNKDLKNMLVQNSHIKEILVNEALYYFQIFSIIFSKLSKDREIEKLRKEEQKEIDKQKAKYHVTLPAIDMKKILSKVVVPRVKLGIVGCGNIGKKLLRSLIKIKDKKLLDFQIQISTRQPEKLMSEFLNELDDDIKIMLNNEKLFDECDIIFLCVQPTQLDLLLKEINIIFNERIEKLSKKEYKCFPLLVSFLSATTIKRLQMLFPKKVHIIRTRLLPNYLSAKKKSLFGGASSVEEEGDYINESSSHLLEKEKNFEIIENLIKGLTDQFYSKADVQIKKNTDSKVKKIVEKPIIESPLFLFEVIFGKENAEKYYEIYDYKKGKFKIPGLKEKNDKSGDDEDKNNGSKDIVDKNDDQEKYDPEQDKIIQAFTKNICTDFKSIFSDYLTRLLKTKK